MSRKKHLFEGRSWIKFNYLGLALGIALKLYTSAKKELKLKVRNFWRFIHTSIEVTGEKLVESLFGSLFLNRVNVCEPKLLEKVIKLGI